MKRLLLIGILLCGLSATLPAHAIPIQFDVDYRADLGPNGTGTFFYDDELGFITNFMWNFSGVVGGVADSTFREINNFSSPQGRTIFEIISQRDVDMGSDCVARFSKNNCGAGVFSEGFGPFNSNFFVVNSFRDGSPVIYSFFDSAFQRVATGTIVIAEAAKVSEPGALVLFILGLAGVGAARRKYNSLSR